MATRRLLQIASILTVAASLVTVGLVSAKGGNDDGCYVRADGCTAKVTFTVTNNPGPGPVPICLKGAPFYRVKIEGNCGLGDSFGPLYDLVCSAATLPATFTDASGRVHTLTPMSGRTWAQLPSPICDGLEYTVE